MWRLMYLFIDTLKWMTSRIVQQLCSKTGCQSKHGYYNVVFLNATIYLIIYKENVQIYTPTVQIIYKLYTGFCLCFFPWNLNLMFYTFFLVQHKLPCFKARKPHYTPSMCAIVEHVQYNHYLRHNNNFIHISQEKGQVVGFKKLPEKKIKLKCSANLLFI